MQTTNTAFPFPSSAQHIETILQNPKESYDFISNHGKNPQIIPYLIQILIQPDDEETNSPLRIQAAILLRNGFVSWYINVPSDQIDGESLIQLGQTLVDNLLARGERDSIVRKQITLCVGEIGKYDLRSKVPTLFHHLTIPIHNVLSDSTWSKDPHNFDILNGCLGGFHQLIQELIRNLPWGQCLLHEAAISHFAHIYQVYSTSFSIWTGVLAQQTTLNLTNILHSQPIIELSRICLKILSQMSTYAWEEPHEHELPTNFLKECVIQWTQVLQIRQHITGFIISHKSILNNQSTLHQINSFFNLFHKLLFKFGKFFSLIFRKDPHFSHSSFDLSTSLKQSAWQMINEGSFLIAQDSSVDSRLKNLALYPEKIVLQSLQLMRIWVWNQDRSSDLTVEQSIELAMTILQRLLILQPHSLEFWNEDPEGYDNEEENSLASENRCFDVRACAADVLNALLFRHPHEISNVILQKFSSLHSQDLTALPILLQLESAYYGIGLAAYHLMEPSSGFDLTEWITSKCMPILRQIEPSGVILRRRIAWALGQFAKRCSDLQFRNYIYAALSCLLENPSSDLAVKIETCRALKATGDWRETDQNILHHLEITIKQVLNLLSSVENLASQKVLTDTLRFAIEKAGPNISPFASQTSNMMASLWQKVDESPSKKEFGNRLHNTILVTMSSLVKAIGPISQDFHETITLFVAHSVNPNNPSSEYLQEDASILWLTSMRHTEIMTSDLAKLLNTLSNLIQDATDSLGILLKILESYILLDSQLVLNSIGIILSNTFSQLLHIELKLPPTDSILHAIESIVNSCSPSIWQAWFEQSDCFLKLIQRSTSTEVPVDIAVKHLLTICRLIVTDVSAFFNLIASLNPKGISPTEVLSRFCRTCFDKIDNVRKAQDRKLIAAALACLVSKPNPIVLNNLSEFVSIWSSVLAEGDEILNKCTDTFRYSHESEYTNEFQSQFEDAGAEAKRTKQLLNRDPVKTKTLDKIISENICAGGQLVITGLNGLDTSSLHELQQRLTRNLKG